MDGICDGIDGIGGISSSSSRELYGSTSVYSAPPTSEQPAIGDDANSTDGGEVNDSVEMSDAAKKALDDEQANAVNPPAALQEAVFSQISMMM